MRRALSIQEQSASPDDPGIATLLTSLSTLLTATNRLSESQQLLTRAFPIIIQNYGKDHPEVAHMFRRLAAVCIKLHQMKDAQGLLNAALEIDLEYYGRVHPVVASDYNALGVALQNRCLFTTSVGICSLSILIPHQHHPVGPATLPLTILVLPGPS